MHPERSRSHGPGGLKRCSACGEEKRAADFYVSRGRLSSYCKDCQRRRPDVPTTVAARTRPPERACEAKHRPAPQAPGARTAGPARSCGRASRPGPQAPLLLRRLQAGRLPCPQACPGAGPPASSGRHPPPTARRAGPPPTRPRSPHPAAARRDQPPRPLLRLVRRPPRSPHHSPRPGPPTTAPGAATTADTPRPPRPGSPRKPPTAGPSRAAPGQVRSVGDDGRIVTRPSTEQGERYGSSATAATNGS
jgi:hypothetical protein